MGYEDAVVARHFGHQVEGFITGSGEPGIAQGGHGHRPSADWNDSDLDQLVRVVGFATAEQVVDLLTNPQDAPPARLVKS